MFNALLWHNFGYNGIPFNALFKAHFWQETCNKSFALNDPNDIILAVGLQ